MKHFLLVLLVPACTTLGPMPGTTGIAAVPVGRPGIEATAGTVAGYYLSQTVQSGQSAGQPSNELAVVVEPDRVLGIPGLIVGGRAAGDGGDRPVEPFVGYRTKLDANLAVAGIVYGMRAKADRDGADYAATRAGGELAIDARVIELTRWLAIHAQAAGSLTALSASGHYCADSTGVAADCSSTTALVDAKLSGIFPTATATLSLDAGRRPTGVFQSARLAILGEVGTMPTIVDGEQRAARQYHSLGLTLTLGFGAND